MALSIRWWSILALNGLVLLASLLQGWVAQRVAGEEAKQRVAVELSEGVSRFLSGKSFPLTNTMMGYLHEILSEDWVAVREDGHSVIGSSLAPEATREFESRFGSLGQSGEIALLGASYHFSSHQISDSGDLGNSNAARAKLFVLIPTAKLQTASHRASKAVAVAVLPMTVGATVIALALAFFITNPIRTLAQQMDRLAAQRKRGSGSEAAGVRIASEDSENAMRRRLTENGPTELRRLASSYFSLMDRLDAAMVRLVQSDRLAHLGKMCLSVGHELRNPLSGIKMNIRVLRDRHGLIKDEGMEAVEREIDRMGIYLEELMSLGSGRPEQKFEALPVKLSALAESVLTIMSGRCRHLGIEIRRVYSAGEPLIKGDPNQLRQVMMNLFANAMDAMPSGGTLTVRIIAQDDCVAFEVVDTGTGVAGEFSIFEAFASGKPGGVGLGLHLSRQIVERHGGVISYRNAAEGTVFLVKLPIEIHDPRTTRHFAIEGAA